MEVIKGRVNRKKAIAVAKDVLKHIESKSYAPTCRHFVNQTSSIRWFAMREKIDASGEAELSEYLEQTRGCQVCMLGAAWLSAVRLFNEFVIGVPYLNIDLAMQDIHDPKQSPGAMLAHIFGSDYPYMEVAFEVGHGWFSDSDAYWKQIKRKRFEAAVEFGRRHKLCDATSRMKAICRNIIRNEGRFIP